MTAPTIPPEFDKVFGPDATAETCRELREEDARRSEANGLDSYAGKYDSMSYAAKLGIACSSLEHALIRVDVTCEIAEAEDMRPWVRNRLESIMEDVRKTLERIR